MKECCASCVWFYVDDDGEELCTVNPPDYKGRYPKVTHNSKCKDYEAINAPSSIMNYETKDARRS